MPGGYHSEIYIGWPIILSGLKSLLETGSALHWPNDPVQ